MTDRPILFSTPMVRAILAGEKTQTRRIVKPQPTEAPITNGSALGSYLVWPNNGAYLEWQDVIADPEYYAQAGFCPHGQPGDRLWVRETWNCIDTGRLAQRRDWVRYRATDGDEMNWRPSIFMPRWASRITLEITSVRVERVQSISMYDAMDEGVGFPKYSQFEQGSHLVGAFRDLWNSINAKRGYGWEVNPWVWVVAFKVVNDARD